MKSVASSRLRHLPSAVLAAVALAVASPAHATGTFNWSGATSGAWPIATNWDSAPTSDNQTNLVFNVPTTVMYLGNARTVRSLTFDSGITSSIGVSFNYSNNTSGINLTMSALSGNASINVNSGSTGAITLGIATGATGNGVGSLILSSNLDVIHNGSGQLTFNRIVSGSGALTKTGTGSLAFTGGTVANTYGGLTTVSGGGLTLSKTAGTDAIAGDLLVNGTGTVTLNAADQIKNTSNVEVAAGTIALATFAETVNGVKLTGGAITNTSSAGILTSTTAYDFQSGSASAILAGTVGANKTGAGTVTLSGANTFTGVTTIGAGILSVGTIGNGGVAGNLGQATNAASNLVFDGGTLAYTGSTATSDRAFTINAGKTAMIDTGANSLTLAGATGTATTGALTKTGAGTLILTGTSTYTGNTTISAGTLSMASNLIGSSANIFIGNGATLSAATSGFSLASGQTLTGTGATGTVTGLSTLGLATSGNNTISNNASGQLSLTRLSVFGSGNTITAGDIQSGVSGTSRGLNIANGSAGTLTITGGSLTTNGNSTSGDILGSTNASGVGNLIINGGSYTANSAQGLNIGFGAGSGTLTLTSGNVTLPNLTLSAVSLFTSAVVNLDGGTFTLGTLTVNSGLANAINFNGGTFKASATGALVSGAGTVTFNVKNGGAIIDTNTNNVTISNGLINFGGTSTGGLTKQNAGTLSLSGANTYAGVTTVSAGTLLIDTGGSISNTSRITVASGATIQNNNGAAITGALTLTEGSSLITNAAGSSFDTSTNGLELVGNLSNGWSAIALTNTAGSGLIKGGALTFTLTGITAGTYDLDGASTGFSGSFSSASVGASALTTADAGATFTGTDGGFNYLFTNSTNTLTIAAVPEPSTWVGAGLITSLVAWSQRKRLARIAA